MGCSLSSSSKKKNKRRRETTHLEEEQKEQKEEEEERHQPHISDVEKKKETELSSGSRPSTQNVTPHAPASHIEDIRVATTGITLLHPMAGSSGPETSNTHQITDTTVDDQPGHPIESNNASDLDVSKIGMSDIPAAGQRQKNKGREQYRLRGFLNAGSYSQVFTAEREDADEMVAIKCIYKFDFRAVSTHDVQGTIKNLSMTKDTYLQWKNNDSSRSDAQDEQEQDTLDGEPRSELKSSSGYTLKSNADAVQNRRSRTITFSTDQPHGLLLPSIHSTVSSNSAPSFRDITAELKEEHKESGPCFCVEEKESIPYSLMPTKETRGSAGSGDSDTGDEKSGLSVSEHDISDYDINDVTSRQLVDEKDSGARVRKKKGKGGVACSTLTKRQKSMKKQFEDAARAQWETEKEILTFLRGHPNIIGLIDAFEDTRGFCLVLEYIKGNDLFEFLKQRDPLTEREIKVIMSQILRGAQHMHQMNVAHSDFKLENILIMDRGQGNYQVKICDFGLSRFASLQTGFCGGTIEYLAPEIVKAYMMGDMYKARPVDVWALGVILYVLVYQDFPFLVDNSDRNIAFISILEDEPLYLLSLLCSRPDSLLGPGEQLPKCYDEAKEMALIRRDTGVISDQAVVEAVISPGTTVTPIDRVLRNMMQKDAQKRITLQKLVPQFCSNKFTFL